MIPLTHADLVKRAKKWLLNTIGCGFVLSELSTAAMEIPDGIGWKDRRSILIECKATRSDFLSDKRKYFRKIPEQGMGTYRLYMCPPGIINQNDLPDKWGLLYCHPKKIQRIVAPKGSSFYGFPSFQHNQNAETILLTSALRRVHLRGDLEKIYSMETL